MAYEKQTWEKFDKSKPKEDQPNAILTEERMNHIEDGIVALYNGGISSGNDITGGLPIVTDENEEDTDEIVKTETWNSTDDPSVDPMTFQKTRVVTNDITANTTKLAFSSQAVDNLYKSYGEADMEKILQLKANIDTVKRVEHLINFEFRNAIVYGVKWRRDSDDPKGIRIYSNEGKEYVVGDDENYLFTNFDYIYPWRGMVKCTGGPSKNNGNNFIVSAYEGESHYTEDGSIGDVWVEIPKFYYKEGYMTDEDGIEWEYLLISNDKVDNTFKVPDKFVSKTMDFITASYIPAYNYSYVNFPMTTITDGGIDTLDTSDINYKTKKIYISLPGFQQMINCSHENTIGKHNEFKVHMYDHTVSQYPYSEFCTDTQYLSSMMLQDWEVIRILATVEFATKDLSSIMKGAIESGIAYNKNLVNTEIERLTVKGYDKVDDTIFNEIVSLDRNLPNTFKNDYKDKYCYYYIKCENKTINGSGIEGTPLMKDLIFNESINFTSGTNSYIFKQSEYLPIQIYDMNSSYLLQGSIVGHRCTYTLNTTLDVTNEFIIMCNYKKQGKVTMYPYSTAIINDGIANTDYVLTSANHILKLVIGFDMDSTNLTTVEQQYFNCERITPSLILERYGNNPNKQLPTFMTGITNFVRSRSGSLVSNTNGYFPCRYRYIEQPWGGTASLISDVLAFKHTHATSTGYSLRINEDKSKQQIINNGIDYTDDTIYDPDSRIGFRDNPTIDGYKPLYTGIGMTKGAVKDLVETNVATARIPVESNGEMNIVDNDYCSIYTPPAIVDIQTINGNNKPPYYAVYYGANLYNTGIKSNKPGIYGFRFRSLVDLERYINDNPDATTLPDIIDGDDHILGGARGSYKY